MTAKALGFDRPMANSLDAVSARDFALDFLMALRLPNALCISPGWRRNSCSGRAQPFRFIPLPDAYLHRLLDHAAEAQSQTPPSWSAAMIGPDRRLLALALLMTMKGLPLAYAKDTQDDKEPVFLAVDSLMLAIAAMSGMARDMQPNREGMLAAAKLGFTTATDLADWLVQNQGLPFREAHHVSGSLVSEAEARGCGLEDLPLDVMQGVHAGIDASVYEVLKVENSAASRTSFGGCRT